MNYKILALTKKSPNEWSSKGIAIFLRAAVYINAGRMVVLDGKTAREWFQSGFQFDLPFKTEDDHN